MIRPLGSFIRALYVFQVTGVERFGPNVVPTAVFTVGVG